MKARWGSLLLVGLCWAWISITPASASDVSGPDPAVRQWPAWPYQVSCGITSFDPVSVFGGPTGAEAGSTPAEMALRSVLDDPTYAWLGFPRQDWRLVSGNDEYAEFIWGRLTRGMERITLQNGSSGWKLNSSGTCQIRSIVRGSWAITWSLASSQPRLGMGSRRVRIDLGPGPCSSGVSQNDRAHPVFRQIGRSLLLSIVLDPLPPGVYTCQGVIEPPLVVKLPGRLGQRKLYVGSTYPPILAAETRALKR
jgi:hypothetical protein